MDKVYLDYAATTPLDPGVLSAMQPCLVGHFANPNSLHSSGREAFSVLEQARKRVSELLGAKMPSEIIFNSGGTEGDNAALFGLVAWNKAKKPLHLVVSAIEHHAVLHPAKRLASLGHEITYLAPGADGVVSPEDLRAAIKENTALVSIMTANNEIGSVQPIRELAEVAHAHGALFHTDAVQALGKCPIDLEHFGADAVSFSGHKIYGPKGIGVFYLRRKTSFLPQMLGGGQENGRRSGTQNVAGAVGFAAALERELENRADENQRLVTLRDHLIDEALSASSRVSLSVDPREKPGHYLPHIASLLVDGLESETMILRLDQRGFEVSGGSACSSSSLEPSHVLKAIGVSTDLAYGSLRISLGRYTTLQDIDAFVTALSEIL